MSEDLEESASLGERLLFLLDQLTLTSELFLEATAPVMEALKTARAPRSLGLEGLLAEPQECIQALQFILEDFEKQIPSAVLELDALSPQETQALLEQERLFWQEFVTTAHNLTQKLALLAPQEQSASLTVQPLQDSWQELLRLAEVV